MTRIVLPALVLLAACTKPLAKDKETIWATMHDAGDGTYISLFSITMGVDAVSRAELRPELEMNVGGPIPEGTSVSASFVNTGLQTIPTTEPSSHTGSVAIEFEPGFSACDGTGYTERSDGGCEIDLIGIVTASAEAAPLVGFIARVYEPETGFEGVVDDLDVQLFVDEAQPE